MLNPVPAEIVTPFAPLVFEVMMEVVLIPAPTPKIPSFATFPSISVPVTVIVLPDVLTVLIPAPAIVTDPPELESVAVFEATEIVCNSLVTLPSISVPVMVICPPFVLVVSDIAFMPAALIVTPAAPVVFDSKTEDVAPPAPTPKSPSFAVFPSTSVPVIVKFG